MQQAEEKNRPEEFNRHVPTIYHANIILIKRNLLTGSGDIFGFTIQGKAGLSQA